MSYTKINFVKKSRKDIFKRNFDGTEEILIAKGESYYWWKWRFGKKNVSKTHPGNLDRYSGSVTKTYQDLIQRADEAIENNERDDDLMSEIMQFKEEREEALSNLEQYFPEGHVNEMLTEMIDELDNKISELEAIYEDD
jgi:hypothetical protein